MRLLWKGNAALALFFIAFSIITGTLTLVLAPKKVLGSLIWGYMGAEENSSVFQRVENSFQTFDEQLSEYFVLHDASIHAYGGIQRVLNRNLVDDAEKAYQVLRLKNGYLTFKAGNSDYTNLKDYLLQLKEVCDTVDCRLLYVSKPNKSTTDPAMLPAFYPYLYRSNLDEIMLQLEENDVLVLDLESSIAEEGINKYSLFFKTDHHWTAQAGIWASQRIIRTLNEKCCWELDADLLDMDDFDVDTYKEAFLGSQGKRVGGLYGGIDDFCVVTPNFDTMLTVETTDSNSIETGTFEETLIHRNHITPGNLLNKDDTAYSAYMDGNHDLVTITNHSITNGKRALFILDSYGCVVAPYLALCYERLDCIDIRSYHGSIEQYVEQTVPDVVIYMVTGFQ